MDVWEARHQLERTREEADAAGDLVYELNLLLIDAEQHAANLEDLLRERDADVVAYRTRVTRLEDCLRDADQHAADLEDLLLSTTVDLTVRTTDCVAHRSRIASLEAELERRPLGTRPLHRDGFGGAL